MRVLCEHVSLDEPIFATLSETIYNHMNDISWEIRVSFEDVSLEELIFATSSDTTYNDMNDFFYRGQKKKKNS